MQRQLTSEFTTCQCCMVLGAPRAAVGLRHGTTEQNAWIVRPYAWHAIIKIAHLVRLARHDRQRIRFLPNTRY